MVIRPRLSVGVCTCAAQAQPLLPQLWQSGYPQRCLWHSQTDRFIIVMSVSVSTSCSADAVRATANDMAASLIYPAACTVQAGVTCATHSTSSIMVAGERPAADAAMLPRRHAGAAIRQATVGDRCAAASCPPFVLCLRMTCRRPLPEAGLLLHSCRAAVECAASAPRLLTIAAGVMVPRRR